MSLLEALELRDDMLKRVTVEGQAGGTYEVAVDGEFIGRVEHCRYHPGPRQPKRWWAMSVFDRHLCRLSGAVDDYAYLDPICGVMTRDDAVSYVVERAARAQLDNQERRPRS